MSSQREVISGGVGQGRTPDQKSSFVQTCNLLSQYIKEKGSVRDLNLEIGGKVESLVALVRSGASQPGEIEDMEKFNQPSNVPDSAIDAPQDTSHKSTSEDSSPNSNKKTSQLTIFYSGRVLVFDDFPVHKARELVAVAKRESISSSTWRDKPIPSPGAREGLPPRPKPANGAVKPAGISSDTSKDKMAVATAAAKSTTAVHVPARSDSANYGLPFARRASINKFIEKRKNRAVARGPYQVQEQLPSSLKGDDNLALKL